MALIDSHIPEYTLEEKEKEIIIEIIAPLSKPKEAAFVLEKGVFSFESPPYILRIKLPHTVSDRFSQQAYDNDTGRYKIKLKKTFGVQENTSDEDDELLRPLICENEIISSNADSQEKHKVLYGFANKYSNMFGKLYYEFSDIINLPNPDLTPVRERRNLRVKEENEKWDDSHYLADTMETEHLECIFNYKPHWITCPVRDEYKNEEKDMLVEIIDSSKIASLSEEHRRLSEFQIVDVLFAYAYNKRTTEGDNTVESGWTINKLSSTLSWFEVFEDLKVVLITCYRRSLIFPLYRNWNLAQMIHKDVVNVFKIGIKIGSKQVSRCLLEVREIFNESDNRYILNTLYVNDLCNFAYHMIDERCWELSAEVEKINIKKYEVNSDLPLLEIAAHLTLEEETNGPDKENSKLETVVDKIGSLNLSRNNDTSSDSSESDSEESDSSQSSDKED